MLDVFYIFSRIIFYFNYDCIFQFKWWYFVQLVVWTAGVDLKKYIWNIFIQTFVYWYKLLYSKVKGLTNIECKILFSLSLLLGETPIFCSLRIITCSRGLAFYKSRNDLIHVYEHMYYIKFYKWLLNLKKILSRLPDVLCPLNVELWRTHSMLLTARN